MSWWAPLEEMSLDGYFIKEGVPPYENESGKEMPAPRWATSCFVVDGGREPPTSIAEVAVLDAREAMYMDILGEKVSKSARHAVQAAWLEVAGTAVSAVEVEEDPLAEWSLENSWKGAARQVERATAEIFKEFAEVGQEPTGRQPVRGEAGLHRVELMPGANPCYTKSYRLPPERAAAMKELVQGYEDKKWIEKVSRGTAWASPAFLVTKPGIPTTWRMVVDYRKLNTLTRPDHFPMPEIEEVLNRQEGFHVWSVINLKDTSHQIPLHAASRACTAFTTSEGVWQWSVMPMGLAGAPAR